jgi:hypothetical protein
VSNASSQAWAFYREVAAKRIVWTIRDASGYPVSVTSCGHRAQPFWSSRSRVERIIRSVPAYAGFEPREIAWDEFCRKWAPGMTAHGLLVGVNWSGEQATGYNLPPARLVECVRACIDGLAERKAPPDGHRGGL